MLNLFTNRYPYTDFHELNADWIIRHFHEFIEDIKNIDSWISQHETDYEELKKLYDDFMAGNFTPEFLAQLNKWVVQNAASIIDQLTKMVFFGITDDGYFVAYIPDTWDDITFNTSGLDITVPDLDYGHLILSY